MARFDDDSNEPFPFWSHGEVTRVSIFVALAALPILIAHADHGVPAIEAAHAGPAPGNSGQLRSVRISTFDLNGLRASSLADREEK
ncbi:MAG: hypothetical protein K2Y05_08860 [Hyphomicrobiaceae bacterium]|nr:hypothetical protein [Hyphomicrobiaceae bacterium]